MPQGLIIMPVLDNLPMTLDAIGDSLQQLGGAAEVWVINQGSTKATREGLDALARTRPRLTVITHDPPLPALGQTWNTALEAAWACGHEDAMVVNNDVRMGAWIYEDLREGCQRLGLWFASPVNTRDTEGQWEQRLFTYDAGEPASVVCGGPDFSCFLLTREGHTKYPFDTRYAPAYFEDNDLHRRYWVGGDGGKIAGLPIPYLHLGGQTAKAFSPEKAARWDGVFDRVRQRYVEKWGGLPHRETKITPDSEEDFADVGTPGGWLGGRYPVLDPADQTTWVWKEPSHAQS